MRDGAELGMALGERTVRPARPSVYRQLPYLLPMLGFRSEPACCQPRGLSPSLLCCLFINPIYPAVFLLLLVGFGVVRYLETKGSPLCQAWGEFWDQPESAAAWLKRRERGLEGIKG